MEKGAASKIIVHGRMNLCIDAQRQRAIRKRRIPKFSVPPTIDVVHDIKSDLDFKSAAVN